MPVYRDYRLVHIHIPKTGGTAIASYFEKLGALTWTRESWVGLEHRNGRWYEYQHLSMREFESLSQGEFDGHDSFAVVRNPYARMVSDFLWRQRISREQPGATLRTFDSFEAFVHAIPEDLDSRWLDHLTEGDRRQANFLIHVRPQYQYVFDLEGNRLVDEILRFESLGRDADRLLERHHLRNNAIRSVPERDFQAFYDRGLLDRVNEIYVHDFECFSYEML